MERDDSILTFESIEKSFFGVRVLKDITLSVPRGKVLGLVGENGAGKSTLMNLMGGVHAPDRGQMLLDGKPYAPRTPSDANAAGMAFIHQELNLFTNLSIAENIFIDGFPRLRWLPVLNRGHMRARTKQFLDAVEVARLPRHAGRKALPRRAPTCRDRQGAELSTHGSSSSTSRPPR
jgi:ribose transport system ATP-binding protein